MIQIDMDMPTCCYECHFNSPCDLCQGYESYCQVGEFSVGCVKDWNYTGEGFNGYDQRHKKCPLIEVGGNDQN